MRIRGAYLTKYLVLALILSQASVFAWAEQGALTPLMVIARKGDTVGGILDALGICPLWGEKRSVDNMLRLNDLDEKSTRQLLVGQKVKLPVTHLSSHADYRVDDGVVQWLTDHPVSKCNVDVQERELAAAESTVKQQINEETPERVESKASDNVHADEQLKKDFQDSFDEYSELTARPTLGFSKLQSVDNLSAGKSILASNLNYGLTGLWSPHFSESKNFKFSLELERYSYVTSSIKTLGNATGLRVNFAGQYQKQFTPALKVGAIAGIMQGQFLRADTANSLTLDQVAIPRAGLGAEIELLKSKKFEGKAMGSALVHSPMSNGAFVVRAGYSLNFESWFGQYFKNNLGAVGIYFNQINQSTSVSSQYVQNLGMYFQYTWGQIGAKGEK